MLEIGPSGGTLRQRQVGCAFHVADLRKYRRLMNRTTAFVNLPIKSQSLAELMMHGSRFQSLISSPVRSTDTRSGFQLSSCVSGRHDPLNEISWRIAHRAYRGRSRYDTAARQEPTHALVAKTTIRWIYAIRAIDQRRCSIAYLPVNVRSGALSAYAPSPRID